MDDIYSEISDLLEDKDDLDLEYSIIIKQLERYNKSKFPPPPEEKISEEETTFEKNIYTNVENSILTNLLNKRNRIKNEIQTLRKKIRHNAWRLSISQKAECLHLAEKRKKALQEHKENWNRNHPFHGNNVHDYDTIDYL